MRFKTGRARWPFGIVAIVVLAAGALTLGVPDSSEERGCGGSGAGDPVGVTPEAVMHAPSSTSSSTPGSCIPPCGVAPTTGSTLDSGLADSVVLPPQGTATPPTFTMGELCGDGTCDPTLVCTGHGGLAVPSSTCSTAFTATPTEGGTFIRKNSCQWVGLPLEPRVPTPYLCSVADSQYCSTHANPTGFGACPPLAALNDGGAQTLQGSCLADGPIGASSRFAGGGNSCCQYADGGTAQTYASSCGYLLPTGLHAAPREPRVTPNALASR